MSFTNCFVLLLSLSVAVQSLTTPIVMRSHHHAIAARIAAPVPIDVPAPPVARRQNSRRCKPRSVSSSVAIPTSSSPPPVAVKPAAQQPQPTTSSTPAPQPTTTPNAAPAPQPTTTYAAPAATTAAASTSSGNEPSFMIGTQTGQGTFYATGLGACGITNKDTDYIAAVSHLLFDAYPGYNGINPNDNPVCGKTITAHYQGKSVTITVTDRCQGCAITDLDFSPSAFDQLADPSVGRISGMTWDWN